ELLLDLLRQARKPRHHVYHLVLVERQLAIDGESSIDSSRSREADFDTCRASRVGRYPRLLKLVLVLVLGVARVLMRVVGAPAALAALKHGQSGKQHEYGAKRVV